MVERRRQTEEALWDMRNDGVIISLSCLLASSIPDLHLKKPANWKSQQAQTYTQNSKLKTVLSSPRTRKGAY